MSGILKGKFVEDKTITIQKLSDDIKLSSFENDRNFINKDYVDHEIAEIDSKLENYVDLSNKQTIVGQKTFMSNVVLNGQTAETSNITFLREGQSYINSQGLFAIVPNGGNLTGIDSYVFNSDAFYFGNTTGTNTRNLGREDIRWSNVYANSLNTSGTATIGRTIYGGGKTSGNDGNPGYVLSPAGHLYLQGSTGNPSVRFFADGATSHTASLTLSQDTHNLELNANFTATSNNGYSLGSQTMRWSNVFTALLNTSGNATIGGAISTNGKTSSLDGNQGIWLHPNGNIYMVGSPTSSPTFYMQQNGDTSGNYAYFRAPGNNIFEFGGTLKPSGSVNFDLGVYDPQANANETWRYINARVGIFCGQGKTTSDDGVTGVYIANNGTIHVNAETNPYLAFYNSNATTYTTRLTDYGNNLSISNNVRIGTQSSILPKASLDVTGSIFASGAIYVNDFSGQYITAATTEAVLQNYSPVTNSGVRALYKMETYEGNILSFTQYQETIGFMGYYADRLVEEINGTDFRTYWEMKTGRLVHNADFTVGGELRVNSTPEQSNSLTSQNIPTIGWVNTRLADILADKLNKNDVSSKGSGSGNIEIYRNVFSYSVNNNTTTGIMCLVLPVSWTNSMNTYKINLYQHKDNASAEIMIQAYNYITTPIWSLPTLTMTGNCNYSVKLAHNGERCVILFQLPEEQNRWSYPKLVVSEIYANDLHTTVDWSTGWKLEFIENTSSLTHILEPVINQNFKLGGYLHSAFPKLNQQNNFTETNYFRNVNPLPDGTICNLGSATYKWNNLYAQNVVLGEKNTLNDGKAGILIQNTGNIGIQAERPMLSFYKGNSISATTSISELEDGEIQVDGSMKVTDSLRVQAKGASMIESSTNFPALSIINDGLNNTDYCYTLFRMTSAGGNVIAFNKVGDNIGFRGFFKSTIDSNMNIADFLTVYNTNTGTLTHNQEFRLSGTPRQTSDTESYTVPNIGWVNTRLNKALEGYSKTNKLRFGLGGNTEGVFTIADNELVKIDLQVEPWGVTVYAYSKMEMELFMTTKRMSLENCTYHSTMREISEDSIGYPQSLTSFNIENPVYEELDIWIEDFNLNIKSKGHGYSRDSRCFIIVEYS